MIIDNFTPTKTNYTSAVVASYLMPMENTRMAIEVGTKVGDFVQSNNLGDVTIEKDGVLCSTEYIVKEGDVLYMYVIPEGGSGSDYLKMAVMIAVAISIPQLLTYGLAEAGFGTAAGFFATSPIALGIATAVGVGLTAYALNKWFPPDMPSMGDSLGTDSSTYGWGDTTNKRTEGQVLPILLGNHRIKPPYVNVYVSTSQDGKQTINQLFALSLGQVDGISGIIINNNDISNYTGTSSTSRMGLPTQTVIGTSYNEPDFTFTRTDYNQSSRVLNTSWYNFETNSTVEKIGLTIAFNGLGKFDNSGNIVEQEVECEAQYSLDGNTWNYITSEDFIDNDDSLYYLSSHSGRNIWAKHIDSYSRVGVIGSDPQYGGNIYGTITDYASFSLTNPVYVDSFGINGGTLYKYMANVTYWVSSVDNDGGVVWSTQTELNTPIYSTNSFLPTSDVLMPAGGSTQLKGQVDWLSCKGATQEQKIFYFETPKITNGKYHIRVRRKTADDTSIKVMDKSILVSSSEFLAGVQQRYPSIALLGIKALATDQLNGELPTVSVMVSRMGQDISKPLNNPAWAVRYLIVEHLDGTVNESKFQDWADYCSREGYFVNIYIETQISFRKLIDMIASLGQGYVFQKGLTYDVRWEDYQSAPVQAFIFNDSNIAYDSYNETYLSVEERFNTLELTYFDETLDYERNTVILQQDTVDLEKKTSLVLYGCTNREMAIKLGKIALRKARYETLISSWSCDIDAIHCGLYDIVYVQHSVPKWNDGASGLCVSATSNTITIDQEVELVENTVYKLRVQHIESDVVEEVNIMSSTTQTTNILPLVNNFATTPSKNAKYTFKDGRYFKIVNISKTDDLRSKITAIEYIPEIYNIDIQDLSNYVIDRTLPKPVSNIVVNEQLYYDKQGNLQTVMILNWDGVALSYKIELGEVRDGNVSFRAVDNTTINSSVIYGLVVGETYRVKVNGVLASDYTLLGKLMKPSSVTNLTAISTAGILVVKWTANTDLDFAIYEITTQGKTYRTTKNEINISDIKYMDSTLNVYAIDTSGVYSDATTISYDHREKSIVDLISDSYMIEKGFQDGRINMFWNQIEPNMVLSSYKSSSTLVFDRKANDFNAGIINTTINNYDLWAFRKNEMTILDYSSASSFVQFKMANDFNEGVTYRYYWEGRWYTCTTEQEAVVNRLLRYVTNTSVSDGLVRIFSSKPSVPYEVGDLWIDGEVVRVCTTSKYE